MSWGYRITILTVCFVGFMLFLVVKAFRQDFDLVSEDYYAKEIAFQEKYEKQRNQYQLKQDIHCELTDEYIVVQFPNDFQDENVKGKIFLYRPSDASRDITIEVAPSRSIQKIEKKRLLKGLYRIQIDYSCEGKEYYYERDIMI